MLSRVLWFTILSIESVKSFKFLVEQIEGAMAKAWLVAALVVCALCATTTADGEHLAC